MACRISFGFCSGASQGIDSAARLSFPTGVKISFGGLLRIKIFVRRSEIFLNTSLKNFLPPTAKKFSEATPNDGNFSLRFDFYENRFSPNLGQLPFIFLHKATTGLILCSVAFNFPGVR